MLEPTTPALKEWASAIKALETGRQIMVMRKGGIVEETRHFEPEKSGVLPVSDL